jgi:phosphonoacetate hydrolase
VKLLEAGRADFLYLSTTDYMQHKFAPEDTEVIEFYAAIDAELGRLLELGAVVGVTADHGMNAKRKPDGSANVIYLESELVETFDAEFRVILPITDPYVAHHGALGSFAMVHLPEGIQPGVVAKWISERAGVTEVYDRAAAARKLELPADRLGDLVVVSGRDVVLGRTPEYHDLNAVGSTLRSHGGRYEEMVPFVLSEPLSPAYAARAAGDFRNFDIFDFTCNASPNR